MNKFIPPPELLPSLQFLLTLAALLVAVVSGFAAWQSAGAARASAELARRQTTVSHPPKLLARHIHIWDQGQGVMYGRDNPLPSMKDGSIVEGAAFVTNVGPDDAEVVQSDLIVIWRDNDLNMNHPDWKNPGGNRVREIDWKNDDFKPLGDDKLVLRPTAVGGWKFRSPPKPPNQSLYVIGNVVYRDTLGGIHGTYFARRYDPKSARFLAVDDDTYEFVH